MMSQEKEDKEEMFASLISPPHMKSSYTMKTSGGGGPWNVHSI